MDDGRAFLPPVKPGLRVGEDGGLKFCKRWEKEDQKLCPMERTRRVIHETLVGVEEYLVFTTETSEDFKDGWLPTLDTSVKVDNNNQVLFTYYEKPTTAKRTVMKRSAMAEKATIQVHSNDPIRRFMNTREDLPDGDFCKMTDEYAQKLLNSGFEVPQVRKILIGGIKASGRKLSGTRKQEQNSGRQHRKAAVQDQEKKQLAR